VSQISRYAFIIYISCDNKYQCDNFIVFYNYYTLFLIFIVVIFFFFSHFNIFQHENSSCRLISISNMSRFCSKKMQKHFASEGTMVTQDANRIPISDGCTSRGGSRLFYSSGERSRRRSKWKVRSKTNSRLHKAWDVSMIRIHFISSFFDLPFLPRYTKKTEAPGKDHGRACSNLQVEKVVQFNERKNK